MKLYVNGALDAGQAFANLTGIGQGGQGRADLIIGASVFQYGHHFDGAIDEVALWNRALSAEEVRAVYRDVNALLATPHVTRIDHADRILLDDGTVLLGTIQNDRYAVTTSFGKLEAPAGQVVGLLGPAEKFPAVRLLLADGQVWAGTLGEPIVRLKLSVGSTLRVDVGRIRECGYRISEQKPPVVAAAGPTILLSDGGRLLGKVAEEALTVRTRFGDARVRPLHLRRVDFDKDEPGTVAARQRDGVLLKGRLAESTIRFAIAPDGPTVKLPVGRILSLVRPAAEPGAAGVAPTLPSRPAAPAEAPSPTGPVALWRADGNAKDSAGENHGRLANGAAFAPGRFGKAFRLDGGDDHITIGDALDWGDGSWSVALWFRWAAGGAERPKQIKLINKGLTTYGRPPDAGYSLEFEEGRLQFEVASSSQATFAAETQAPDDHLWHHVVGVLDRKAGRMRLYLDGRLAAERPVAGLGSLDTDIPLCIGGLHRAGRGPMMAFFPGDLDEVAMWSRALSPAEVRSAYAGDYAPDAAAAPGVSRIDLADRIRLADDTVLLGTIQNDRYTVTTSFGKLEIPAARVAGLLGPTKETSAARLVLTDGQALAGTLTEGAVLLRLSTGSTLRVPVADIRECGYRICEEKPAASATAGPMAALRGGDWLALADAELQLELRTAAVKLPLPIRSILRIESAAVDGRAHRVRLANSSRLTGTLLPETLTLNLKLGRTLQIPRSRLHRLLLPTRAVRPAGQATLRLRNGDVLIGRIGEQALTLRTAFGDVRFDPVNVLEVRFGAKPGAGATVRMWDETVLRGRLVEPAVSFAIVPGGPTVKLQSARIESIVRASALPPADVVRRAEALIAQLGAASFVQREAATRKLIEMGAPIRAVLEKHHGHADPEVRERIERILEAIGRPARRVPPIPTAPPIVTPAGEGRPPE
jgi:hypothetical protein